MQPSAFPVATMADGGEAVSRALALMDQFYLSMMESGVLKILAFQYECFAEISEETYLKFLGNFSTLSTSVKALHEEIFLSERRHVACQTARVSLPGHPVKTEELEVPSKQPPKVQKVHLVEELTPEYRPLKTPKSRYSVKREPMVCDYCEQKFTTLENFEIHIRRVHGEQFSRSFFSCQICTQHFLSSEALYEHIACAHHLTEDDEEKGDQLCAYCAELLLSWQDLADHLIAVHNVYMCKTCHVLCETEEAMANHITTTHLTGIRPELMNAIPEPPKPVGRPPNTTPKPYMPVPTFVAPASPRKRGRPRKVPSTENEAKGIVCKICKIRFPTEESLKKHIVYRHEPAPKELMCKKCNLKFRRRSALENHMRIVHNTSEISDSEEEMVLGPANIPIASTSTADMLSPPTKETSKTPRPGGRIHCDVCGEMCAKPEEQEIHKDHHATRRMDRFLCLYCTAPGMSQHELRTHIVSEHRYRCPFCSLTFWWKTNLESHLLQLHNSKEECPKCGLVDRSETLRQHILLQHTPRKLYVCKVCGSEHVTVREMHDHDMTHAKTRKLVMTCELCQRTFGSRSSLKGHLLRHLHGSFCCYLCGQQCRTQEQLQNHLLRHKKSQFACFCGRRFAKKPDLQAHQRTNVCKQGVASGPKADIFVEVCVPGEEEDLEGEGLMLSNATKMQRLCGDEQSESNVWQINIDLPAETPAPLSRDFLSTLAHSVNGAEGQDTALLATGRQSILILDSSREDTEATLIEDQPAEIVQWLHNQRTVSAEAVIEPTTDKE